MGAILVTGGAGYIGSHVCKTLSQLGHLPVSYDDLSRGFESSVRWGPLIQGRVHDTEKLKNALTDLKIEAVIHLAAFAYVAESVECPDMYFENNVEGTRSLIEAMIAAGVNKIVFSSSCATYGEAQKELIDESHPQHPVNPYGESKRLSEKALVEAAAESNLQFCGLRYFNAGGADPDLEIGECHHPEPHIIPSLISACFDKKPVVINGRDFPTPDGTCIRDFIHVSDLSAAHGLVLDGLLAGRPLAPFYNLGTGEGLSLLELVREVERVLGQPINYSFGAKRSGDPARLVASANLFKADFGGWEPLLSKPQDIIESAAAWAKKKGSSIKP